VAFQNEQHYLLIGKRLNSKGNVEIYLEKTDSNVDEGYPSILSKKEIKEEFDDLFVKIAGKNQFYNFYYKTKEHENWILLAENVDAIILSTNKAKGFVGTYLAMYTSTHHFN